MTYKKLWFSESLGAGNCGSGIVGLLYKHIALPDYFTTSPLLNVPLPHCNNTGKKAFYHQFTDAEVEAQRSDATCPTSHSQ